MTTTSKIQLFAPFVFLMLAVVLVEALVINSLRGRLKDAESSAAELAQRVEDLSAAALSAARADETATREMEARRDETISKLNEVREKSCHIDDDSRLDDRLRELIADAYRVAVCTETDAPPMPAAAGAAAP